MGALLLCALTGPASGQDAGVTETADSPQAAPEARDAAADPIDAAGEVITVTGTRSESPRAASPVTIEVIDRKRLAESGVQTAADALALRPGIWMDRSVAGTQGISMQGLGPQYTLILVDGARQIGRTDGTLDLERFGVEDIEQIEIVRGPSSVLYGSDALGGVVNFVSRTPKDGLAADALARVDGRRGYEARGRLAGGRRGSSGAIVGQLRHAEAIALGDIVDDTPADSPATAFDAYDDAHVTARGRHQRGQDTNSAWRFDASADYLRRELTGTDAQATGAVFDRTNLVETAAGQVGTIWTGERTAARVEVGASLYRDQYLSDQRNATAEDQYQETNENLIEARAQAARELGAHKLLAGIEGLREALESDRLEAPGDRYRGAVFVQDEWRLGETGSVLVVPAARLDVDSQFGTYATPRLAARWQANEKLVVRGSAGMGYRAPNFKELLLLFSNPGVGYVVEGNPDLTPERSVSVQAGGEWRVASWLQLSADTYFNQLRDMISFQLLPMSTMGDRFSYENIGRARTYGGEAYAIAAYGRAGLELGGAVTRSKDLSDDSDLQGIPRHRATITARWRDERDGVDAFAAAVFTGQRPLYLGVDLEPTLTARRWELRARVAKRFRNGLGGFLGVDNLLDTGSALDRVPPRTIYAGIEIHR